MLRDWRDKRYDPQAYLYVLSLKLPCRRTAGQCRISALWSSGLSLWLDTDPSTSKTWKLRVEILEKDMPNCSGIWD